MTAASLLAFSAACAVIELTPGPNMAYQALIAASQGRRPALAAVTGVALGLLLVGLAAALGLAALIANSTVPYHLLLWAGVGYFLWLAWESGQSARETSATRTGSADQTSYFQRGLVTNLLNPKAAIFYVAVLPTFIDPAQNLLGQGVALSLVFVAIATGIHFGIVLLAGMARPLFANPGRAKVIRRLFALALAGIGLWLGLSL